MDGIVTLLNQPYYKMVEDIWAELEQQLGLRGVYVTPYPHFTYHVATRYDNIAKLETLLQTFAATQKAFTVRTSGVGVFTGDEPVVYIPVVRTPELNRLHTALWECLAWVGSGVLHYYTEAYWLPHISLGMGDVSHETLPHIISLLGKRDFYWELPVDHIALIYDDENQQAQKTRFDFSG